MYKTHHSQTTFGSWHVQKVHTVVARSTFPSQNVQNTPFSDHFWKLTWWKSACRCGAKHISKSKVQKTDGHGALFDVQTSFRVAGAVRCQKWKKTWGFCRNFNYNHHYAPLHYCRLHYNYNYNYDYDYNYTNYISLRYTTLHYLQPQLQLHYSYNFN